MVYTLKLHSNQKEGIFPLFFVLKKIDKKLINILHGGNFIVYL